MTGALSGCSFLFVSPPPNNAGYAGRVRSIAPVKCTSSKTAPIVDTVIASLQGVRTGIALGAKDSTYEGAPISRGTGVALGIGFVTLFAASAAYGYVVTGHCIDANGGTHYARPRYYREAPVDADPDSPPPRPPRPPASLDRHR